MIAGELYMLRLEYFSASSQDFQDKNKPETIKEPQYKPKYIHISEIIDPTSWMKLCVEYKDLFKEPGTSVE